MKKLVMKKLVLFMILIIATVTGGSITLHMRGLDGGNITVVWVLFLVVILGLLDLIYLIIIPIIRMIKGKDDPPPELNNRASPARV